ncbi:MAG: SDR family oxidoreductase [Rhodobacteraceae bacterium]|nr:SDR family oxidoreductase [Paracoccaceae bacterium]
MRLDGKNAIITGAAQGMGSTITETMASEGADLVLVARSPGPIEELAEKIRATGRRALAIAADTTDEEQVIAMVAKAKEFFDGRIDILVNAMGATGPIETPVWEIGQQDFSDLLRKNVIGVFLPMKHVIPAMIDKHYGKIVTIGGGSGLRGYRYRAGYSASKWSVRGLTRSAAIDCGEHNINVNAIMPGIVETPRMHKLCQEKANTKGTTFDEEYAEYLAEMPIKRVTTPQHIADAVVFLASDASENISGQEMPIDGGWTA